MMTLPCFRVAFLCFVLVISLSFCYAEYETKVEVVGTAECADCPQTNTHPLSGLHVSIDCKPKNGKLKTRGEGEVDHEGKFKVELPSHLIKHGKLKEDCYLHTPCTAHSSLESSKILLKSQNNNIYSFGLATKLTISPATCASEFLWPHFKPKGIKNFGHPYFFHPFPHKFFPPKYPHYSPVPVYYPPPKEEFPPPTKEPCPPYTYFPPTTPSYKPPSVPMYEPKPKHPIFYKPFPPKWPPIH